MTDTSRRGVPEDARPVDGPRSPVADVADSLKEAKSFLAYYLSTQADKVILLARNAVIFLVVGLLGLLVAATVLVTATVYVCSGIVGGLEQLFGRFGWVGAILFGVLVLTTVAVAGYLFVAKFIGGTKERLVSAYDRRQRQQRSEFGTDVQREAARARSN